MFDQIRYSINQIVGAGSSTLAGVYRRLTSRTDDPFPHFKSLLDDAFPSHTASSCPLARILTIHGHYMIFSGSNGLVLVEKPHSNGSGDIDYNGVWSAADVYRGSNGLVYHIFWDHGGFFWEILLVLVEKLGLGTAAGGCHYNGVW